ncbi:SLC13 family permease [Alicyclobacillus sp. SO9]|uniref:SLC13 family permease n=1 Tax=Alicyclobacillus sp. SO9 TaxID=2665646 RepID=UPI0018E7A65F|nr:SLC13 family permease [Alicyclobacillus sp. SO9]QQE79203.1 SLC13 family permease [Alicyclobacillus sp. SO9]
MTLQIGFVLTVVSLMMVAIVTEIARPDIIVFMTLVIFILSGTLPVDEALQGFSNKGMLTIALLFIVAGAVEKSGVADKMVSALLRKKSSDRRVLLKVLVPTSILSGFLNNTPIVVTLTPVIKKWAADRGISPSKFLLPLSYATILGGTITLMGTSTNLVINGMLDNLGLKEFTFFQLAYVGIPALIVGLIYLIVFGSRMLPNHKVMEDRIAEQSREYLSEIVVENTFPHNNKTIREAGLRNLKGLFLIEIIRGAEKISPVRSTTLIRTGDRLIFTGLIETIAELQHMKGLRIEAGPELTLDDLKNGTSQVVEVVVSHQSSNLLHRRIRDAQFRSQFDAGVIAVHRNGERIETKVGDIRLRAGDTLLLLAGPDFYNRVRQSNSFYVTTPLGVQPWPEDKRQGWISIMVLVLMIVFVATHVLTLFKAILGGVVVLLATKAISPEEAKNKVQFSVLLLISSAFGVGAAIVRSGAAAWVANGLVNLGKPIGVLAVLAIVYLITNVFTEFITNNAAAVIMLPIGLAIAAQMHANPMAFIVVVAIAASASFSTPIGYQTNLIVYGPGGYKFKDYLKVGIPLNLIVMLITILVDKFIWLQQ